MRLVFVSSNPPALVTTDSITYVQPALSLANGQGFDLTLRRTPGYPLFLAGVLALSASNLSLAALAQHLLGVATIVATYWLGVFSFGRLSGLVGGFTVALSGPQLIYEHYLMTEPLFTLVLVLSLLGLVAAARRNDSHLYLLSGALFGACALIRPIGQLFLIFVPLTALLAARDLRRALSVTVLAGVGFAVVLLPWMARNYAVGGSFTSSTALGKTLFGRITRHDDGLRFDLPSVGPAASDPVRASALEFARQAAENDASRGSLVHAQLMRDYGYSEAQAYAVMRDAALEVLLAQPDYWLASSAAGAVQLLLGKEEPLREHFARLSVDRLRNDWRDAGLASLLPAEVRPEARGVQHNQAVWVSRLYEPSRQPQSAILAILLAVGTIATFWQAQWRLALGLPLLVICVLASSALLDGPVPRFRYPLDPVIAIVATAGGLALLHMARRLLRSRLPSSLPGRTDGPTSDNRESGGVRVGLHTT